MNNQKIVTHLWYDKEAKEAVEFYVSVFKDAKITSARVIKDTPSGDCDILTFKLFGQEFMAISAGPYFKFSEAISLVVKCDTQEEIDEYWAKLSAHPESEQCGWLKDKYGLSWQIVPRQMDEMMKEETPEQIARVTQSFLQMKKFDIAALEAAFKSE